MSNAATLTADQARAIAVLLLSIDTTSEPDASPADKRKTPQPEG